VKWQWPKSSPDYKWPASLLSLGKTPRRALLAVIFHVAHAAGRCARWFRPRRSAILAIRTDGIGDAVLAEPMLASFARQFPDHALHLWAPPSVCELLRAAPYIDVRGEILRGGKQGNLELFASAKWRARLGYRLGREKFTAAAYLAHSPEPLGNWLLASARAEQRWYAPGNTENQFAAQQQSTSLRATRLLHSGLPGRNDLERNALVAHQWGDDIGACMPTVHLDDAAYRAAAEQVRMWRRLAAWLGAQGLVGLMPAASMPVKRYPASAWAEAAGQLWNSGILCGLIGGPEDREQIMEVSSRIGRLPHLRMVQPLDLPATAALIGSLDGLLSVDTGLAHIAMAQDVPTVALIGGGHPKRFFPWPIQRRAVVLNHSMPCEGCRLRCHLREAECVTRIDPMEIAGAMARLLDRPIPIPLRAAG
jgi:ADP-heptose:LPS heptosyltransferase